MTQRAVLVGLGAVTGALVAGLALRGVQASRPLPARAISDQADPYRSIVGPTPASSTGAAAREVEGAAAPHEASPVYDYPAELEQFVGAYARPTVAATPSRVAGEEQVTRAAAGGTGRTVGTGDPPGEDPSYYAPLPGADAFAADGVYPPPSQAEADAIREAAGWIGDRIGGLGRRLGIGS